MKRRECLSILAGLPWVALTSASVAAEPPGERSRSVAATYSASFDQVWAALAAAVESLGLPVSADDKVEGYVLCETGTPAHGWRERIAIFVERAAADRTRVAVVFKQARGSSISVIDSIPRLFVSLDTRLPRV